MSIRRLPLSTCSLYAELLEQLTLAELSRDIGDLAGGFTKKVIKGRTYWYLQHSVLGKQKQIYLGPDSAELRGAVDRWRSGRLDSNQATAARRRLVAMLHSGGAEKTPAEVAKLLHLLAESGVFRVDAILVGTHAFRAFANMLCVAWPREGIETQDVDLAGAPRLTVALGRVPREVDWRATFERAQQGLIPVPPFDPGHPVTAFCVGKREIRLDLLAPMMGPSSDDPVKIESLGTYAQPLRFLDYLLEHFVQAALVAGDGVLVNVPDPARFALHKLIVAGRRGPQWRAKARKDVREASLLIEVLAEDSPGDLLMAWEELTRRRWTKHLQAGLKVLPEPAVDQLRTAIGGEW